MHRLAFVLGAVFLASCSTKPIAAEQAVTVRALAFKQPPSVPHGAVTIVRDAGAFGSACPTEITVEGTPATVLQQGQKVVLYLAAGRQTLGAVSQGGLMCGTTAEKERRRTDLEIYVEAGDVRTYRISISSAGIVLRPAPIR